MRHGVAANLSSIWLLLLAIFLVTNIDGFSPVSSVSRCTRKRSTQTFPQQQRQHNLPSVPIVKGRLSISEGNFHHLSRRQNVPMVQQKPRTVRTATTKLSLFSFPSVSSPMLESSDTWGNLMMLTGAATVAQRIGTATLVGRLLGAPVSAMALTFVMASIGILPPGGTAASKSLQALSIQMATPLVLLGADFTDCLKRCGPLILSFLLASFGTIAGCYVGWTCFGDWLSHSMKKDGLKIAAALLAKNVGGGINYVAVCRTLQASPASMAAGLCVDNLMALLYFPLSTALGAGRPDVEQSSSSGDATTSIESTIVTNTTPSRSLGSVQQITTIVSLSAMLLWMGERLGGVDASLPCCTLLTVLFANVANRWIQPMRQTAELLGITCLYWFFATAGAPGLAVAESVQASLLPLGMYLVSLYGIHSACLFLSYQLFARRKPTDGGLVTGWKGFALPQRLLVASSAAIGGPATAVALAQTHGWTQLQVPSILVGNMGYAIATFCGLAFHQLLQGVVSPS